MTTAGAAPPGPAVEPGRAAASVARLRVGRRRRHRAVIAGLGSVAIALFAVSLVAGDTPATPTQVLAVLTGADVDAGTAFAIGRLRLPRAALAVASGAAFGLAGVTFQTMLRNPLASPDLIGISAGASTAAAFAIVVLGLSGPSVAAVAVTAGLAVALLVYVLAYRDGVVGSRLILIGIGVAAMLESATAWVVLQAGAWDLQLVLRWLTGSLNGATWQAVVPVAVVLGVAAPVLLAHGRALAALRLGDDAAAAIGVPVERTRFVVVVAAVGLVAFATAGAGPIAFVAFLSGPIALRLTGGTGSPLVPAALVGVLLVLGGDLVGQHLTGMRFPVGIVTGVLGAPYLVYLIVRSNQRGVAA